MGFHGSMVHLQQGVFRGLFGSNISAKKYENEDFLRQSWSYTLMRQFEPRFVHFHTVVGVRSNTSFYVHFITAFQTTPFPCTTGFTT